MDIIAGATCAMQHRQEGEREGQRKQTSCAKSRRSSPPPSLKASLYGGGGAVGWCYRRHLVRQLSLAPNACTLPDHRGRATHGASQRHEACTTKAADHLELRVEQHEETPLASVRGNPDGPVLASMPGMDTSLDRLSEERAQRDVLGCELLDLECATGQQRR